jgi:hypothetical protein
VADREARVLDLQAEISGRRMTARLGERHEVVVDAIVDPSDPSGADRADELGGALAEGAWQDPAARARFDAAVAARTPLALGRSHHFGYDLDGVVVMPAANGLAPGHWCTAAFVGVTPWDVWAEPA